MPTVQVRARQAALVERNRMPVVLSGLQSLIETSVVYYQSEDCCIKLVRLPPFDGAAHEG